MYPQTNSLYSSPLSQNINPFALAGSMPQTPTWLQASPQQQYSQFTPPHATLQVALQLAAQQLAQQLTGQQSNPAFLQQALYQLAQFHYGVAQQLFQLAAIPAPQQQGLFGSPYPNQFVPGALGPNFAGVGTLH